MEKERERENENRFVCVFEDAAILWLFIIKEVRKWYFSHKL